MPTAHLPTERTSYRTSLNMSTGQGPGMEGVGVGSKFQVEHVLRGVWKSLHDEATPP